jgi:hypothetical protein
MRVAGFEGISHPEHKVVLPPLGFPRRRASLRPPLTKPRIPLQTRIGGSSASSGSRRRRGVLFEAPR